MSRKALSTVSIFINYRTDDDGYAAAAVDERLRSVFGDEQVFRDCRSLDAGVEFSAELWRALRGCRVLLAMVGPHWLTLTDHSGRRRIDAPDDFVRREIAEALRLGKRVVPVLLDNTRLPDPAALPADIAEICRHQSRVLRVRHSTDDLDILVRDLRALVPAATPAAATQVIRHGGVTFNGNPRIRGDVVAGDKPVHGGQP